MIHQNNFEPNLQETADYLYIIFAIEAGLCEVYYQYTIKDPTKSRGNGGAGRDRTDDLLDANQALSQLSYSPFLAGLFSLWLCWASRSFGHVPDVRSLSRSYARLAT